MAAVLRGLLTQSRPCDRKVKALVAAIILILCLAIGLGVGLAVKHHHDDDSSADLYCGDGCGTTPDGDCCGADIGACGVGYTTLRTRSRAARTVACNDSP